MTESQVSHNGLDPMLQPFVDFWAGYFREVDEAVRRLVESFDDSANAKTWQQRWSDALSRSMDAYLRSPMFLEAMKQHTDLMIKIKRQADDLATEIARNANIPTASDISGLFERLHSVEEVILQRLDRIETRLKSIEEQTEMSQGAGI